jgi:hypothetical protein
VTLAKSERLYYYCCVNLNPGFVSFFFLAYTTYAFFEWSLILYDVAFDAVTALDFQNFEFFVVDVTHGTTLAASTTEEG